MDLMKLTAVELGKKIQAGEVAVLEAVKAAFDRIEKSEKDVQLVKSIPVASFVILVLLWVSTSRLSTIISFLMVLPVVFTNVRGGIRQVDEKLLEMAEVFRLGIWKKVRAIYLPAVKPSFLTACSIGLGFCFKSGIAAEVIGLPANSIGGELYKAKLYLMTPELFAWTIVIVAASVLFEKLVMWGIRKIV